MKRLIASLVSLSLPATLLTVGGLATTVGIATTAVAPPAAANPNCNFEDGQLCDGSEYIINPPAPPPPPPPPNCEELGTCGDFNRTDSWTVVNTYGGSLWFWDTNTLTFNDGRAGQFTLDYSGMWATNQCTAQQGFADAPMGGTSYTIRVGRWLVIEQDWTRVTVAGESVEQPNAPRMRWETRCWYYSTPTEVLQPLTVVGEGVVNGPYDYLGKAMLPESEGGTLTRRVDGTLTAQGKVVQGFSALGKEIEARTGATFADLASGRERATPREAWTMIRDRTPLNYWEDLDIDMPDMGRYYQVGKRFRNGARVYPHTRYTEHLERMFPSQWAEMNTRFFLGTPTTYPMWIPSVTAPIIENDIVRWKQECVANTDGQRSERINVDGAQIQNGDAARYFDAPAQMPPIVMDAQWNDNENSYGFECRDGYKEEDIVRLRDLFVCDDYDQTFTVERNRMPVQTATGRRWAHIGWRYWWGTGGADCGRWSNGDPWCRAPEYGWENYTYDRPTPSGYTKVGREWVADCPESMSANADGRTCTAVEVSDIFVDNKNAAPVEEQNPNWLVSADSEKVVGEISSHADPFQTVWRKPSISVNTGPDRGKNVNNLPPSADVRWSRRWTLDLTSSPILKDNGGPATTKSANDLLGPTHIHTDTTATTDNDFSVEYPWTPDRDNGTGPAAFNRWVGLESAGWEDTQRALWTRFFQAQNEGTKPWTLTPEWKVTATVPVKMTTVDTVTIDDNGELTFTTSTSTDLRRESYVCPGQRLQMITERIVSH